MIRSLTYVHPAPLDKEFAALGKLFDALGFAAGAGWDSGKSRGAGFRAPVGDLEIYKGESVTMSGVLVEVSDLDSTHRIVTKSKLGSVSKIEPTAWNARLFRFTIKDLQVTFWQFDQPHKLPFQTMEG